MKNLITRNVGSTFVAMFETMQVVENQTCEGCIFYKDPNDSENESEQDIISKLFANRVNKENSNCCRNAIAKMFTGPCDAKERKDGKQVIFRKID